MSRVIIIFQIERGWNIMVGIKIERQVKVVNERSNEVEVKPETIKVAETLGKFGKMKAKNDAGDKSGYYGSRG